ncbi:MAG: hypothetical protein GOMPHAMPRED_001055 [Gomphillus americanus]|uniref:CFEM domain-containing protein n=1 Tax=Gomphillus americanus TaxID=1940652 RepID=A0A8H3IK55_9LECA|nr:MAG: hypothetical protein GOMPHAMPRED_001055 [Gomphillus americanus]
MQFQNGLFNILLLSLSTSVFAQDLSQVPSCALGPAITAFSKTGCEAMDIKCICSKSQLIPELQAEISKVCSVEEVTKAAKFAIDTCKNSGVGIKLPTNATV